MQLGIHNMQRQKYAPMVFCVLYRGTISAFGLAPGGTAGFHRQRAEKREIAYMEY